MSKFKDNMIDWIDSSIKEDHNGKFSLWDGYGNRLLGPFDTEGEIHAHPKLFEIAEEAVIDRMADAADYALDQMRDEGGI